MIKILVPYKKTIDLKEMPTLVNSNYRFEPGAGEIVNFLNELSKKIIRHPILKKDPAYVALGFWLRKANINKILEENQLESFRVSHNITPVGTVFHLCPSNVDTMFFYSLTLALLGGNKNIIRVSSRLEEKQVFILFDLINEVIELPGYSAFKNYINIITYERNDKINEQLSLVSDARVIWGGDKTIEQFKSYKTKYRVKDLYFADRISYSVINGESRASTSELDLLCDKLYNDIYSFDQMGCSSPHCLFVVGDIQKSEGFLKKIYNKLIAIAKERYKMDISSMASFKLNKSANDILKGISGIVMNQSNYLILSELTSMEVPHSCGMGYLYYKLIDNPSKILPYLNEKVQTITQWGFSDEILREVMLKSSPNSLDRIVPVGKALEFSHIWDGYNILLELVNFKTLKTK